MIQNSTAVRNAGLDNYESTIGTAPKLRILTGSPPADCATAQSGTLLCEITLPSDWMAAAAGGSKAKLGTWQANASAPGTAGYYRIVDSAGSTCHEQGSISASLALNTNGTTAANGNVLNFASTTGVVVGMNVSGTGVPAGATVVAVTSTTVTLSRTSTAGVGNAVAITFAHDLVLDNISIASGQQVTVGTFTRSAGNA
jgi:hypothetical protein